MEYNIQKHSFICEKCGPGLRKWKDIYTQVLLDEETDDCYCIIHDDLKIGHTSMVPEWGQDGNNRDSEK